MHTVGVGSLRDTIEDSIGPSLGAYLREQRRSAQLSLRQLAERAEVSNPYLSQVERGLRHPSAQVLAQIARGLQISATALYVRAGLLDEPTPAPAGSEAGDAEPEVVAAANGPADVVPLAVHADPYLQPRHKRLLLEVYETLRREAAAEDAARATADTNTPQSVQTAANPGRTA